MNNDNDDNDNDGEQFLTMGFNLTLWLFNSLPWKITMLLIGKPR